MKDEKSRNPPETEETVFAARAPQSRYFRAVVQEDEPAQMDVFRWLQSDECYEVAYIRHDRDVKTDDADDDGEDGVSGDDGRIKPHYHILMRVPKKCTAKTMTKRFGGYVHFQVCADPFDYARYLTHEVFRARHKFRYNREDVGGDKDFYFEMLGDADHSYMQDCKMWGQYMADCNGDLHEALGQAIINGNKRLVKSLMSHSYFYEKYFTPKKGN